MEEFYKTKAKLDKKEKRKQKKSVFFKNKIKSTLNYTPRQIKTTKKMEMETGGEG
ncbi:TPA: hypothetical protein ACGOZ1_001215 [Streptococcus suis]